MLMDNKQYSAPATKGKTSKTSVLPVFCKIGRGSGSDGTLNNAYDLATTAQKCVLPVSFLVDLLMP